MKRTKSFKHSEKGIATIEATLLLSIFIVFMTYCIGTFGVIHTGILNSISARAYTFETIRNRANVIYFRDDVVRDLSHFAKHGIRIHGVTSEKSMDDSAGNLKWDVTERTLAKGRDVAAVRTNSPSEDDLFDRRAERGTTNPVWVKTVYGVCLDYKCGGN